MLYFQTLMDAGLVPRPEGRHHVLGNTRPKITTFLSDSSANRTAFACEV